MDANCISKTSRSSTMSSAAQPQLSKQPQPCALKSRSLDSAWRYERERALPPSDDALKLFSLNHDQNTFGDDKMSRAKFEETCLRNHLNVPALDYREGSDVQNRRNAKEIGDAHTVVTSTSENNNVEQIEATGCHIVDIIADSRHGDLGELDTTSSPLSSIDPASYEDQGDTTFTERSEGITQNYHYQQQTDYTWSYIVLSTFIALSLALFIIRWISDGHSIEAVSHVYISILIILSIGTMLYCRRNNLTHCEIVNHPRAVMFSRLALMGMGIFFLGSVFFDAVSFVASSECLGVYIAHHSDPGRMCVIVFTLVLKPVYMGGQIAFLVWSARWLSTHQFMVFRGTFLLNGFTNITLILYTTLYEWREIFDKAFDIECIPVVNRSANVHHNGTHLEACRTFTTDMYQMEARLEPYLFCFHAEFYVLATSLNLILWKEKCHVNKNTAKVQILRPNPREEQNDDQSTYGSVCINDGIRSVADSKWKRPLDPLKCWLLHSKPRGSTNNRLTNEKHSTSSRPSYSAGRFWGVLGVCLGTVYVLLFFIRTHSDDYTVKVDICMYFYVPVFFLCTAIATFHLYWQLEKTLKTYPQERRSVSVGSGVLIISAFGCILFNMILVISSVLLMSKGTPHGQFLSDLPNCVPYIIDLFSAFVLLFQFSVQTKVMFQIHWVMKRGNYDDVTVRGIGPPCFFMIVANFTQWVCDTFVETKYVGLRNSECQYFGPYTWDIIIQTLFPFILYYRFHSTMAFAEYLLWKRKAQRVLGSQDNAQRMSAHLTFTSFT